MLCSAQLPKRQQVASPEGKPASRASEVDRKLHLLTNEQGKLLEPFRDTSVRMLRLFNLCDFSNDLSGRGTKARALGLALTSCVL